MNPVLPEKTNRPHLGFKSYNLVPRGTRFTRNLTPYFFILPAFAIYGMFTLFPLVRLFNYSFQDWDGISKNPKWVWLDAVILHFANPRGRNVYRTLVFLPYTLSIVVSGIMWKWIYHPKTGALNAFLKLIGLGSLARGWLGDPDTALTALAMAGAWAGYGFCMATLYDAASVDGANAWQRFRHVTLPGLANTMNVVVLIVFMNTMRVFDFVYVTTEGGPLDSTQVLATIIYRETFRYFHVGFGSALAVVTLFIMSVASLLYLYIRELRS